MLSNALEDTVKRDLKGRFVKGSKHTDETKLKISILQKGIQRNEEFKTKISESLKGKIGTQSRGWKGDNVTKGALHLWVRKYLPKTKFCEMCNTKPPYDLANITGIYNREFKNWKYLCRSCHANLDDYVRKAWITRKKNRVL